MQRYLTENLRLAVEEHFAVNSGCKGGKGVYTKVHEDNFRVVLKDKKAFCFGTVETGNKDVGKRKCEIDVGDFSFCIDFITFQESGKLEFVPCDGLECDDDQQVCTD